MTCSIKINKNLYFFIFATCGPFCKDATHICRGVPRIWEVLFQIWEFAYRKQHAIVGGFLKRCNLVRFRVYFDQILSLFFFQRLAFFIKKNNILDTCLLWGISHENFFENMLRLMRFGVYLETKMAIFIKK